MVIAQSSSQLYSDSSCVVRFLIGSSGAAGPTQRKESGRSQLLGKTCRSGLISLAAFARQLLKSFTRHQFTAQLLALAAFVLAGPTTASPLSSFSALTQSSTSFPVLAAALNIQLMSSVSDLFSRWFFASDHGNLLGCQYGGRAPPPARDMWITCRLLRR